MESKYFSTPVINDGISIYLDMKGTGYIEEYADNDPYTVDMDSIFHKSRAESTIYLVKSVVDNHTFRLLDIGCGKGYITNYIKSEFPESEISGMDYSLKAIEYATNNFIGIDFVVADAYNLPYIDKYFDIVVCNNIYEHVSDPLVLLKSLKRVLKQNGFLIISTPSRYRYGNIMRLLKRQPIILMSKNHVTEYSIGQITEQLCFMGFTVIQIIARKNYFIRNILKRFIHDSVLKPILKIILKWIRVSTASLESTCFYLAKNNYDNGQKSV